MSKQSRAGTCSASSRRARCPKEKGGFGRASVAAMARGVTGTRAGKTEASSDSSESASRSVDEPAGLEALLESLGTDVVELVAAPCGLGVAVGEPVIYDVSERSAFGPGAVVLAIGVRPGTPEAAKLLLGAERAEASAVIFKRG